LSRDILDVVNTPGYVTLIEGDPGAGKTSFVLAACAKRGKCSYISYAEPEVSLRKKLGLILQGRATDMKVIRMMSGNPSVAYSEAARSLDRGELVIIDSLDAMFYGVKDDREIRPFLQLIYSSAKQKSGSLALISEGLNPVAKQVRFVSDAIISIDQGEILGNIARKVRLLKDRDNPIEYPLRYMIFSDGINILKPLPMLRRPEMHKIVRVKMSPDSEIDVAKSLGYHILTEMDIDVSDLRAGIFRELITADYLLKGYNVNYTVGPQEDESQALSDIKTLAGGKVERLNIINPDPQAAGYSAKEFINFFQKKETRTKAINIINLLSEEDFAVKDPVQYEIFVKNIVRENLKAKMLTSIFGNLNLRATGIEVKYANIIRRMTVTDGFLFWRSIKPMGPLHYVNMTPDKGILEFVEMT